MLHYLKPLAGTGGTLTALIAHRVEESYVLAADSRITAGTKLYPPVSKIVQHQHLVTMVCGSWGQIQRALRVMDEIESVYDLATLLQESDIHETSWIVVDPEHGLCHVAEGYHESGRALSYEIHPWSGAPIVDGSGSPFLEGYLAARPTPKTVAQARKLYYNALRACSETYLCVGPPFVVKELPCR